MEDEAKQDIATQMQMEQALIKSRLREYVNGEECVRYAHNDVLHHMAFAIELLHKRVIELEAAIQARKADAVDLAELEKLVEKKVRSAMDDYDISDAISDAINDVISVELSDVDYKIESALDDYDFSDKITDAIDAVNWDERVAETLTEPRTSAVLMEGVGDIVHQKLADTDTYSPIDTALRKFFYGSTFTIRPE